MPVCGLRDQNRDLDQMVDVGLRLLALPLLARMFARREVSRLMIATMSFMHAPAVGTLIIGLQDAANRS
jgi:hypothetical protein